MHTYTHDVQLSILTCVRPDVNGWCPVAVRPVIACALLARRRTLRCGTNRTCSSSSPWSVSQRSISLYDCSCCSHITKLLLVARRRHVLVLCCTHVRFGTLRPWHLHPIHASHHLTFVMTSVQLENLRGLSGTIDACFQIMKDPLSGTR